MKHDNLTAERRPKSKVTATRARTKMRRIEDSVIIINSNHKKN